MLWRAHTPTPLQAPISSVRFLAVSATIPNISEITAWLEAPPAGLRVYGEEMRPCKLRTYVRCVHDVMGGRVRGWRAGWMARVLDSGCSAGWPD